MMTINNHIEEDKVFEDPLIQKRALEHLHEVLEFISPDRKAAYLQALRQCPHLVQTESDPILFLRFEKFNSWSASERLVTYWRKRHELFGDRAFLPIDLSGKGALREDDVNYIASGLELMMITKDNILIYDRTHASDAAEHNTRMRMRFFFLQKLMAPCRYAGPRVIVRGFSINLARTRVNQETRLLIEHAFPIPPIEEVHLTFLKETNQTLWQYIVPFGIQQIAGLASAFKVHNCDSVDELADSLARHNIARSSLPVSLGGDFNQNVNFVRFLLDNGYPAAKLGENLVLESSIEAMDHYSVQYKDNYVHNRTNEHSNTNNNKRHRQNNDHLDNLVDYFISRAPELPDALDSDPLTSSKYILTPFLSSHSLPHPVVPRGEPLLMNTSPAHNQARSISLHLPSDEDYVSEYQCFLRRHIDFFQATQDDIASSARGRNKPIVFGQVGIRCRHCAYLPRSQRSKAATYFPTRLDGIYQTALNLTRIHLMEACDHVPLEVREKLVELRDCKSLMGTGKEYWADAAQVCGVVEDGLILRFR